ncbi:MAG: hypothetical protein AAF939_18225 [Planctomycetota bacterium]
MSSSRIGADQVILEGPSKVNDPHVKSQVEATSNPLIRKESKQWVHVVATFLTTLATFGIFLLQGVVVARLLGPTGRGEFGTALFFPRDILLYAGLLGGVEMINSLAIRPDIEGRSLKYAAVKLSFLSGVLTAIVACFFSVVLLVVVDKAYLIPYCLLVSIFVPWEHMQLTISAVDRGRKAFHAFNVNRLLFHATFVILILLVFQSGLNRLTGLSDLTLVCLLFVASRMIGLLPTLRGMRLWDHWFPGNRTQGMPEIQKTQNEFNPDAAVPTSWELLKQGRFYALSMFASEFFERLDVFLVVAIATVTESGYYFVALPAASLLTVAPNALSIFTFNAGAEKDKLPNTKKVVTVISSVIALQILSSMFMVFVIPILIQLFYGPSFHPAIDFALWLIPAFAIKGFLQAADGYLKGRNRPMVGVWARTISIGLMLGFVGAVYLDWFPLFEEKIFSIPVAALLGQALSMVIITVSVVLDSQTTTQQRGFGKGGAK